MKKILLIDKSGFRANYIKNILSPGVQLSICASLEEGHKIINKAEKFALIILDYSLFNGIKKMNNLFDYTEYIRNIHHDAPIWLFVNTRVNKKDPFYERCCIEMIFEFVTDEDIEYATESLRRIVNTSSAII